MHQLVLLGKEQELREFLLEKKQQYAQQVFSVRMSDPCRVSDVNSKMRISYPSREPSETPFLS